MKGSEGGTRQGIRVCNVEREVVESEGWGSNVAPQQASRLGEAEVVFQEAREQIAQGPKPRHLLAKRILHSHLGTHVTKYLFLTDLTS
jgi:hypothetical protein